MIRCWYRTHEVLLHDLFMFYECDRHIFEDDSLCDEVFTELMIDDFAIILSSDSREDFPLCLRDTESFECRLDILWHIIPGLPITTSLCFRKVVNTLEIECFERRSPRRFLEFLEK